MWRATALPVKIGPLDARVCLPILLWVLYWSWTTFFIAITSIVFFSLVSFMGLSIPGMLRYLRRLLCGPIRTGVPVWERRRFER